jgi:hypothetical protein
MPDGAPTPEQLADQLQEVVRERGGTEPRNLVQNQLLKNLQIVRTGIAQDNELELGDSIREALMAACQRLEPDQRAKAAEALFGLLPTMRRAFLKNRQEKAGELLGRGWDHFRKNYQDDLIQDVADELWRLDRKVVQHLEKDPLGVDRSAAPSYRVISKDYHYMISDADFRSHTYRRVTLIEAVRPGVTQMECWYQWSGQGEEGLPVVTSPGHRLMTQPMKSSNWKYYYIHLGRELEVGEQERVDVEQELYDTGLEFESYLNATISDPGIESVTLQVTLPRERPPSRVDNLILDSHGPGAAILESSLGSYDPDSSTIIWVVPIEPHLGHRYEIRWSYDDGSGIYPSGYAKGDPNPPHPTQRGR